MANPPSHPNAATTAFQDPVSGVGSDQPLAPGDLAFLGPPAQPGDLGTLGKYRVVRLLGQGGMGFVFAAQDTSLRRDIALKVMKPELAADHQFRERFLQEARAAAQVQSEYVVTVFDFGVNGDAPFIAMQLLQGEALQDRLQRDGPLPVEAAVAMLRQAAEGLAAAHRTGMTHRDIKPANLWLESDPATGAFRRVKILDFGLARLEDRDTKLTASGMIVGTPHYMAPEQASGLTVDSRADLFSLGCVAYTALTGRLAFEGASTMAVLMALANHNPTPLVVANLHVPAELSDLVGRMMAKNRDLRPASADEVVAALDALRLDPAPPPAAGPGRAEGGFFGRARPSDAVKTNSRGSQTTPAPWPAQTPKPGPVSAPFTLTAATMPSRMAIPVAPTPPPGVGGPWKKFAVGGGLLAVLAAGAVVFFGGKSSSPGTGPDKAAVTAPAAGGGRAAVAPTSTAPIKVGVLQSARADAAEDEKLVAAAIELAVREAAAELGRPVVAVAADGRADPAAFAKAADGLIAQDKVAALFACGMPADRGPVGRVATSHRVPLFYPVRSEGPAIGDSDWAVYLGPVPNQSVVPAVDYLVRKRDQPLRNVFHVGSDDAYSRRANEYLSVYRESQKQAERPPRLAAAYLKADGQNADDIVKQVADAKPDVVVSTVSGRARGPLLDKLKAVPVLSFGLTEAERLTLAASGHRAEHLVAGVSFVPVAGGPLAPLRDKFPALRTVPDPAAAAYAGVKLWARAVKQAGPAADDPAAVMEKLKLVSVPWAGATVKLDPETRHAYLPCRIGAVEADGSVAVRYEFNRDDGIKPIPELVTKGPTALADFVYGLTGAR